MTIVGHRSRAAVMTVFGTRPEAIKMAPILREMDCRPDDYRAVNVITSQHTDLLAPFLSLFNARVDHNLNVMRSGQSLNELMARLIERLDPILQQERPDLLLVQGDTTSALAGALAAFHRGIPVGHVEAGLRSANRTSPFPEEMNRRTIGLLATYHFAPTAMNVRTLVAEGTPRENVFLTGNPVIDAIEWMLDAVLPGDRAAATLDAVGDRRLVLLTTHRRENHGQTMRQQLAAIRAWVDRHKDLALVFPVHSNPAVRSLAHTLLSGHERIALIDPVDYSDFLHLMARSWLIISDSGGVQEEVPTLGKPLLILRENTERPEVLATGLARLAGGPPDRLARLLDEAYAPDSWAHHARRVDNPYGRGDSARRILDAIDRVLGIAKRNDDLMTGAPGNATTA